jgi:hypothetical protein
MPQYSIPDIIDTEQSARPADRTPIDGPLDRRQSDGGCGPVMFETGERARRCRSVRRPGKPTAADASESDQMAECAVALLQVRADSAAERRGDLPGRWATGGRPRPSDRGPCAVPIRETRQTRARQEATP